MEEWGTGFSLGSKALNLGIFRPHVIVQLVVPVYDFVSSGNPSCFQVMFKLWRLLDSLLDHVN